MEIYCTRPGCPQPLNSFPDLDDSAILKTVPQKYCYQCGMPLILDGRYLPLQLLRRGGFGAAFLACDRRTPTFRNCVVKQLQPHPHLNADQLETATRLFHREAEVLEKLGDHPQIPQFFAFLEFLAPEWNNASPQKFFYLVQEYIQGQNLQQELDVRGRFSEVEVMQVLREMLKVLDFVHAQGSIHRDIKPSNIMRAQSGTLYLIDFGAVKQVISNAGNLPNPASQSLTGIFTPEYSPPEQRQCRAIYPCSDLYALAVSCLHLLTGKPPQFLFDFSTNSWNWREAVSVSDRLANTLNRMLREVPEERFPATRDVVEALNASTLYTQSSTTSSYYQPQPYTTQAGQTEQPFPVPRKKVLMGILGAGFIALSLLAGTLFWRSSEPSTAPGQLTTQISFGGQNLIANERGNNTQTFRTLKAEGIKAFAAKNYTEAVQKFEEALRENANAPETRIYLNNARIGEERSYTIAVTVPITDDFTYRALEMLRGFAQAQEEINENGGINGVKIKLQIIDDDDKPDTAKQIAKKLVKDSQVLAVIGHNSSPVSLAASAIYNPNKLVFITPISITNQLTGLDKPYVFRTNIEGEFAAEKLVEHMLTKFRNQKAAIFFVSGIRYSEDLKSQFTKELLSNGGEVVATFDLKAEGFNPNTSAQEAFNKGAEVLVLFPTHSHRNKAWNVLRTRQRQYPKLNLLGDIATLYSFDTLQEAGDAAAGMVLVVAWHISDSAKNNPEFSTIANRLWGGASVNWATATSYNAIQAIAAALQRADNPTRESLQQALTKGEFVGASGKIQFFDGESTPKFSVVEVQKTPPNYVYSSGTGYDFVPFKPINPKP
jgi:ABC-type branched-subunit amino acid transport system substrate-binding protein